VAVLLGRTGHTVTNGVLGVSVGKNGEEQEQSTGKRTWPETSLVKAESF